MSYLDFENGIKNIGNKYMLVVVVAKRIKDLTRSSPGLFAEGTKELPYVLNEIADKKIAPQMVGN